MSFDLKTRFIEIKTFLSQYQEVHSLEFLKKYPTSYPGFMQEWLLEMRSWDDEKLSKLESGPHEDLVLNQEFKAYLKTIRLLSTIPLANFTSTALPKEITNGLNKKKIHELSLLKSKLNESSSNLIVDIGGGIGHTSLMAVHGTKKRSVCIDQDLTLLEKGRLKLQRMESLKDTQVVFQNLNVDSSSDLHESSEKLLVGLHSCGDLSTHILRAFKKNPHELILFGCCYHKIIDGLYLSQESLTNKLELTTNALHLASRSAKKITAEDIIKRKNFKRHRYSLHYFMFDRFKKPFMPLGNTAPKLYQAAFSVYAKSIDAYSELKDIPALDLEDFYAHERTNALFKDNFNADVIRLLLGRLIELYIILDRAIYLEEQGLKVKISEVFDRSLSPRNIMLEASR